MTAEVAIMNREAIALAADSAVTLGETSKVFVGNKIFSLSRYQPVGVMFYANATFMGAPWETLVKEYRSRLGSSSFPQLVDYAKGFIDFLSTHLELSSEQAQTQAVRSRAHWIFSEIREQIRDDVRERLHKGVNVADDLAAIASEHVGDIIELVEELTEGIPSERISKVESRYTAAIEDVRKRALDMYPFSNALKKKLRRLGARAQFIVQDFEGRLDATGLVVAGFGDSEIFPSLFHYSLSGIVNDEIIFQEADHITVRKTPYTDGVRRRRTNACVHAFAQSEMVRAFMDGVDVAYQNALEKDMWNVLEKYADVVLDHVPGLKTEARTKVHAALLKSATASAAFKGYKEGLAKYRREHYSDRVIEIVDHLPKHELAEMAEALVSLQSLKRRISMDLETVGGPIDVAIISKGDGLIWVKRKHYFDPSLNQAFMANYTRR